MAARTASAAAFPALAALLLGVAVLALLAGGAEAYPRCHFYMQHASGQANDNANLVECKFGWEEDVCGNKVCAKGPGELCGGKHNRYGICSEGLICSNCGRCSGCSYKNFVCFNDPECIWSSSY